MTVTIHLYQLKKDRQGESTPPVAKLVWKDGQVEVETDDSLLKKTLLTFYATSLSSIKSVLLREGTVGFKESVRRIDSEELFKESVYFLRQLNCYGKLEEQKKVKLIAFDFDGTLWDSVPYPGVLTQIKKLQEHFSKVVIATTKDSESVGRLLAPYGIGLDVVGKEHSEDKLKQMSFISLTYQKPFNQIVFVDDLFDQIRRVKSLGSKVALAGWGYSSLSQKQEAEKLGIPILELGSFAETLMKLF